MRPPDMVDALIFIALLGLGVFLVGGIPGFIVGFAACVGYVVCIYYGPESKAIRKSWQQ